jgi:hypothetical protein
MHKDSVMSMNGHVEYVWDGYSYSRLIRDHGDGYITVEQNGQRYVVAKRHYVPVGPAGFPLAGW